MKFIVHLEVDVTGDSTFSESDGRKVAFDLASTLTTTQAKKGRPTSGPRASVVGITVDSERPMETRTFRYGDPVPMPIRSPGDADVME
jgi:hypothetical protein